MARPCVARGSDRRAAPLRDVLGTVRSATRPALPLTMTYHALTRAGRWSFHGVAFLVGMAGMKHGSLLEGSPTIWSDTGSPLALWPLQIASPAGEYSSGSCVMRRARAERARALWRLLFGQSPWRHEK